MRGGASGAGDADKTRRALDRFSFSWKRRNGLTLCFDAIPDGKPLRTFPGIALLLWLAWQAVRPGGRSPFQVRSLPADSPRKLFAMGFLTNLLNPKIAAMYLSLLPQFIDSGNGSVLTQSLVLGLTQIGISVSVNAVIAVSAGSIALFLVQRPAWAPRWATAQRWLMGTVLAALAVKMATEARR